MTTEEELALYTQKRLDLYKKPEKPKGMHRTANPASDDKARVRREAPFFGYKDPNSRPRKSKLDNFRYYDPRVPLWHPTWIHETDSGEYVNFSEHRPKKTSYLTKIMLRWEDRETFRPELKQEDELEDSPSADPKQSEQGTDSTSSST